MSSYDAFIRETIALAEIQGWQVEQANSGHWKFRPPAGDRVISASLTPHSDNAMHEVRRDLEKFGLKFPREREQHMERRARKSVQPTVKALFKEHPDKTFFTSEVIAFVKAKVGEVGDNSVSVALSALAAQDYLIRVGRGEYRYRKPLPDRPAPAPEPTPMRRQIDIAEYAANTEDERILNEALAALGKIQEKIEGTLNEALTSLGQIEEVVRRNRDVARLLVELKEKLR